ncbi:trichohyalin-like isoform X7 [Pomacea canaliculata]|uniref:trichohyalin-like isoform X7 n=1 Tax=Pomacea canaliculata TaxID=400727 RepID=UPI000D72F300|nr:trichohyalin-like isoform X7 [Pomacea canaliculata]
MTAAVDTDIDAFIREQKLKLASERQTLHQEDDKLMAKPIHGHWDLDGGKETRFAEQKDSHETSHHQQRVLTPVQDVGLPVGQYQKKRLALDQERRKEYQEYLRQKQVTDKGADNSDNQSSLDLKAVSSELTQKNNNKQIHSGGYEGLTLGGYEKVKARLREERRQDFLNMLASKLERQYQRNTLENLKKQERELREELDKNEHYPGVKSRPDSDLLYRQEWAKKHTEAQRPNHPAADVSPLRSMGRSDSDQSRENYKQHWQEVHGNTQSNGFNLSAAEVTPRKTKGKLDGGISSPDYRHRWQEVHGNKQSSEKHTRRKWDAPVAPFNGSVLLRDVDADQQKSKQPRRPVNSTSVESQREGTHTQQEASKEMSGLPLGEYEEKRKTYDAQRRQEYSEMRENQELTPRNRQTWKEPSQEGFLPLGNYEKEQEDLRKTRKQDYLDYQQKHAHESKRIWKEPSQEELLPLGKYEETRRKRNKERQDEYKEFLRSQQQQVRNRAWKEHPEGDALSFGHSSESQKQKLEHERREEYKAFLKEKVDQGGGRHSSLVRETDEYKANFPGMNESDNAKIEKVRERNKEYNEFLRERGPPREKSRWEDQKAGDPEIYATLPGLHYSDSALKRRVEERNREYNEFLRNKEAHGRQPRIGETDIGKPPPAPRKGWSTPTYEDILNRKRQQEQLYR